MTGIQVDKIAGEIVNEYRRCQPGTCATFGMMVGLVAALTSLPMEAAFALAAGVFRDEFAAYESEYPLPARAPHAGRFQITFRPELN